MDVRNVLALLQRGENEKLEFKTSFKSDAIESIVAFANSKGGVLLVGVQDNAYVTGVTLGKESLQKYVNQIKQNTIPAVIPDMDIVTVDGKTALVITVAEYPVKPVSYRGRYYKIVIASPGKLYGDITLEKLKSKDYQSSLRNKLIAEAFYLTGNIEKYGSGFIRIEKELKEYPQISFEFKEIANAMQMTFYKQSSVGVNEGINEGVNEGIKSLYEFIKNNPSLRVSQMEKALNIPAKTLERWIKQLKEEDKIEYRGSKKRGGYYAR